MAELRQAAAEVAVTTDFSELPPSLADNLRGEAVLLDNLFFRQGILEPGEWGKLADAFDAAGRDYRAERTASSSKTSCYSLGVCVLIKKFWPQTSTTKESAL